MAINRSLTVAVAAVILGLSATQAASQWSAARRAGAGLALDQARADQAVIAELRRGIDEVAYELDRGALATALNVSVTRDTVSRRRAGIVADLQRLRATGTIARHVGAGNLADDLVGLFQNWESFTSEAAASPATAAEHIRRARDTSERLVNGDMPRLMQAAEAGVTGAQESLRRVEQETAIVSWSVFVVTLLAVVAVVILAIRSGRGGSSRPPVRQPIVDPPTVDPPVAAPAAPPSSAAPRSTPPAAHAADDRRPEPAPARPAASPEPAPVAAPTFAVRPAAAAAASQGAPPPSPPPAVAPWRDVQKMQAIGRLAGGVAHDFNNLLTIIKGHTERLIESAPSAQMRERLEEVQRAADRAAALTAQLLAFSRRQVLAPRLISLNNVVQDLQPAIRPMLGDRIKLELELEPGLWLVRADQGQLGQAIMNLVVNARDAMPDGGVLQIRTANIANGDGRGQGQALVSSMVALSVIDNGIGMDDAVKAHLFEPFFTTKGVGQGTGLGLSTAYGIVGQSGGDILVNTAPGKGTAFTILLPRVAEEPAASQRDGDRRTRAAEMPGIRPW